MLFLASSFLAPMGFLQKRYLYYSTFLPFDVAAEFTSLPDSAPHSMAAPSEGVYVFLCRSPGPPAASASRAPSGPFTRPCIPTVPRGGETHPSGVWEPAVHRNETDTLTTDGVPVQVRFFSSFLCVSVWLRVSPA